MCRALLLCLTMAACGDGRLHGRCDFGTQDGYTICDDVAFSPKTQKTLQSGLDQGHCNYLALQTPGAFLGTWTEGASCPKGALGGCEIPEGDDSLTRWFYPSDVVKTAADVETACGSEQFVTQ